MRAALRIALASVLAVACQAATLQRYPYLQNVRSDRATVMWTTQESGTGAVVYSTDKSFSSRAIARIREFLPSETGQVFPYFQYEAELTNLTPGTQYFYKVTVDGQDLAPTDELRLRTAGAGPFRFLVFGDSGEGTADQYRLAARMIGEENISLVLHAGDIAYTNGAFFEFQANYFVPYQDLMKRVPFFPAPGNHEYNTNAAAPFLAVHSVPKEDVPAADRGRYYSFDWGNVHFVALDTNNPLVSAVNGTGAMLEWLENDLQKTRKLWRVVYFHHAPYASGPNENDPLSALVRERIVPILNRHAVPLVFNGHEHSYQRSKFVRDGRLLDSPPGTLYITTGGGGARLYPVYPREVVAFGESTYHYMRVEVQGSKMTLRAIRADGREIDSVSLVPQPVVWSGGVVNAASFTPSLAPGGLVSIFGMNLAEENLASSLPLPGTLSGISVTMNGRPLPLLYVSGNQINAQLPFDVSGNNTLVVTTPNGSTTASLTISGAAPAIFSAPTAEGHLPTVVHANGTLVSSSSPAETGEALSIFLTGLGRVNGTLSAGDPAPASPPLRTLAPVEVQFGNTAVIPSFSGLAPGFAGLYQVNIQIPPDLPSGTYPLKVTAGGTSSNVVGVAVRAAVRQQGP